jgi:phosphopantetheinyl transferase
VVTTLFDDELHLITGSVRPSPEVLEAAFASLSPTELDCAHRITSTSASESFLCRRYALRRTLASYLSLDPHDVPLQFTTSGKPVLGDDADLHFNISSSGCHVVIAVCRSQPIGVDIENDRSRVSTEIVNFRQSPLTSMVQKMVAVGAANLPLGLAKWTGTEAVVKASDMTLAAALDGTALLDDAWWIRWFRGEESSVAAVAGRAMPPRLIVQCPLNIGANYSLELS